jgi:hypothetical protein
MQTFRFSFVLEAWAKVEIQATNYEKAKDKLLNMSLSEILDEGYLVDYDYKDIQSEEIEED